MTPEEDFNAKKEIKNMLELKNISKTYYTDGEVNNVLKDVSFSIPINSSTALIGRNGAGKSCLLKIISGLINPTKGTIHKSGTISWPVGFAGSFHKDLSGAQNARFVARIYGMSSDKVVAFVNDFADLGNNLYKPIRTYSSGMRSRLAFSISMAVKFDFYLIDEVTAVGDANFKKKCEDILNKKIGEHGALITSHSNNTLKRLCERSIVIEKSKAYSFDTVDSGIKFYEWSRRRKFLPVDYLERKLDQTTENLIADKDYYKLSQRACDPELMGPIVWRERKKIFATTMQILIEKQEWALAGDLAYVIFSHNIEEGDRCVRMLSEAYFQRKSFQYGYQFARIASLFPNADASTHVFLAKKLLSHDPALTDEAQRHVRIALSKNNTSEEAILLNKEISAAQVI